MPIIKHHPQDNLFQRKLRLLDEIASMDVDGALPPTDQIPQDRASKLDAVAQVDLELRAMGIDADADYGQTVWMADGLWEKERADEK